MKSKKPIIILYTILICVVTNAQRLTLEEAKKIGELPEKCLYQEYPNKLSNVLASEEDLGNPKSLHPAFYGCFDWHSAVHGHWSLVYLANHYPSLKDSIYTLVSKNITVENINKEIEYFTKKHEYSYERTYGWNWLLKLQLELEQSPHNEFQELAKTLYPLSNIIIGRYEDFLPKLQYPMRVGTHTNTAFGLTFAYEYAKFRNLESFKRIIETSAKRLFLEDKNGPIEWEPNGSDFLSPCLEEVDIMLKILPEKDFLRWSKNFLPELYKKRWNMPIAIVSDRTDGHLVHLDGLNFSRAWVFLHLAHTYPKHFAHLQPQAEAHIESALSSLRDGNYEGEHWLGTFALYALSSEK